MQLVATVSDNAEIEHFHPRRKFYWTALGKNRDSQSDLVGATQRVINRAGMGPIFLTSKVPAPRAWNKLATTWPYNKEDCLPGMVVRLGKLNKRSEDCGEYQHGEKEPAVLGGYFYPTQISWGSCPLP